MKRLIKFFSLTVLTLFAVAVNVRAQGADLNCVKNCDKIVQDCKDHALRVYITCGQEGGTEATCTPRREQAYKDCIDRFGCDRSCISCPRWDLGQTGQYYCKCGNPYPYGCPDDEVCQTDYSGNCPDCTTEDGLEWQNCIGIESQWQTAPVCDCVSPSPIYVDVLGNGIELTSRAEGIDFDLNNDGKKNRIPGTRRGSDDALLTLDRDGDGQITSGVELFGNFTPQTESDPKKRNGFLALAEFDLNGDRIIDAKDRVFPKLKLWQDKNVNGISEPSEKLSLRDVGITGFELDFKESKYTDLNGNEFRYRAKVRSANDSSVSKWAWDVFYPR